MPAHLHGFADEDFVVGDVRTARGIERDGLQHAPIFDERVHTRRSDKACIGGVGHDAIPVSKQLRVRRNVRTKESNG